MRIYKDYIEMCGEDENKNINPEELFNVMKFIFQNTNEKIKHSLQKRP